MQAIARLRQEHHAKAEAAARTGETPLVFVSDPTFELLVQSKQEVESCSQ